MKKFILITGGAGFIGSNLLRYLIKKEPENSYFILDNLCTGNYDNIKDLINNVNVFFIKNTIQDFTKLHNYDVIYNLGCPASVPKYQERSIFTMDTCFNGVKNILEIAKRCKAKVLHASTSEIYGDPIIPIQNEEYTGNVTTTGPRSCYDEGKRVSETLCYEYRKMGVNVKIARFFNTYGPYMAIDDGRIVTNFISQILNNKPFTIYGDGNQTRSICYIDDLLNGIDIFINSDQFICNIGNDIELTVNDIADIFSKDHPREYRPLPTNDPLQRRPDLTRIKSLGYMPKITPEEGINKTFKYFKDKLTT